MAKLEFIDNIVKHVNTLRYATPSAFKKLTEDLGMPEIPTKEEIEQNLSPGYAGLDGVAPAVSRPDNDEEYSDLDF